MGKKKSLPELSKEPKSEEVAQRETDAIFNNELPAKIEPKESLMVTEDEIIITEKLILKGDLSGLSEEERILYYKRFCERLGLDPFTQPFKLIDMKGKLVLYCDRSGAQQLNKKHKVSHEILKRETQEVEGDFIYIVTARASLSDGRFTDNIGIVSITGLRAEAKSNAMMKAETKAKRRSTLDLLGLGVLDEIEVQDELEIQKEAGKIRKRLKKIDAEKEEPKKETKEEKKPIIDFEHLLKKAKSIMELRSIYKGIPSENLTQKLINLAKSLSAGFKENLTKPITEETTTFDLIDFLNCIDTQIELNSFLTLNCKMLDDQFGNNDQIRKEFENLKLRIKK